MLSYLLEFCRFTGRHTGENIANSFLEIVTEFGIKEKTDYVVTDNASNMKAAFTANFLCEQSDDLEETETMDDENVWEDLSVDDQLHVDFFLYSTMRLERLSCFAHSLQLVVGDALKDCKCVGLAAAKASS